MAVDPKALRYPKPQLEDPLEVADIHERARANLPRIVHNFAELPERTQRMLEGVALHRAGHSWHKASKLVDLPVASLHDFATRHGMRHIDAESDYVQLVEDRASLIFEEASAQQLEALHEGLIPAQSLPVVAGIAADKVLGVAKLRQGKQSTDTFERILERLSGGGGAELTLKVADRAIDITPSE